MTRAQTIVVPAAIAAALTMACGPKQISTTATPPARALIALLPDPDTGVTGRASASTPLGSRDLKAARDSVLATANRQPGPVTTLSEADVQRIFGDALSALPPAPRRFTLFFRFESDELTDESRALVPEVLQTVKGRSFPDVVVVGHTDTMGTAAANVELGLKRARTVRDLLVQAGLDRSTIEVTSHGKADLMIRTPDETPEPRNRRVDITVR
jgi:outer membrane protein OmpA-like peptidoglycan-associated protein